MRRISSEINVKVVDQGLRLDHRIRSVMAEGKTNTYITLRLIFFSGVFLRRLDEDGFVKEVF